MATEGFYLRGLKIALDALTGQAVAPTGTLKLSYMKDYTPNLGTDEYWDDISSDQASGSTTVTLGSVSNNIDTGNERVELDTADPSQATVTTDTDRYVIWLDTGDNATSPLVFTNTFVEGDLIPIASTLGFTVNAQGHGAVNSANVA